MTVTEQQAGEKWCPMVRHTEKGETDNCYEFERVPAYATCAGSGCMMWEWDKNIKAYKFRLCEDRNATVEPDRDTQSIPASWGWNPAESREEAYWAESQEEYDARRLGRCGLLKP